MSTKKFIIILVASLLVTNIANSAAWFFITKSQKESLRVEVSSLEDTVALMGPMTEVLCVSSAVEPGQVVLQSDLTTMEMPKSLITENYILDPNEITGRYYKIKITPGTPISKDLLMDDTLNDSLREADIFADYWPIGLKVGDYVDLRLTHPRGEDYLTLSHKRVNSIRGSIVKMDLTENEKLYYNATLLDLFMYRSKGAQTYLSKYKEPGVQKAAKVYYDLPVNLKYLSTFNPNLGLESGMVLDRPIIDGELKKQFTEAQISDIVAGRSAVMTAIKTAQTELESQIKEAELNGTGTSAEEPITGDEPVFDQLPEDTGVDEGGAIE